MAKSAADITPKFIDDDHLRPRDNSGGPSGDGNITQRTAEFGDGGKVTGPKPWLGTGSSK